MKNEKNRDALLVAGGSAGMVKALETLVNPHALVSAIPLDRSLTDSEIHPLVTCPGQRLILLSADPERDGSKRWLDRARWILDQVPTARVVLHSSLEVYGPDHHSVGMMDEDAERRPALSNARAEFWEELEAGVQEAVPSGRLLILRSAHVIGEWADGWFNRLLQKDRVVTVMGYDPSIQLIHEMTFVRAVHVAIEKRLTGIYNIAPCDALPLHKVLEAAKVRSLPLPWTILRYFGDRRTGEGRGSSRAARLAYFRYSCTGCGDRFAKKTDLTLSSLRALGQFVGEGREASLDLADYSDSHGLDAPFIRRAAEGRLKFFEKIYFRVERKGFEHIPELGPGILVGPHRGFMPLDAVMVVQMITKYSKRVPRFLLHPSLVKLGVLARFMRRMGGVIACKKNADEILKRGDLLGIYPEGIRGPFKYYKDVYKLGRFGRSDYARFALEHSVPVVPFVMVGPAEIYPIFGKLNWNWVQQGLEWPCLPVTPTFPFSPLPFPLPTKWHLQILPPVDPVAAIAEAERTGREPCQVITEQVKKAIEDATAEMLAKRKSIFLGKVFPE